MIRQGLGCLKTALQESRSVLALLHLDILHGSTCGIRLNQTDASPPSTSSSSSSSKLIDEQDAGIARATAYAKQQSKGRFYETVHIKPHSSGHGYTLHLGRFPIRTPGRSLLVLPNKNLAYAVAAEWEWQESSRPALHSMPLMGLAATAIDQPKARDKVIENLLKYLHTDSGLCRYEPGPMAQRQALVFDPLVNFVKEGGLGEGDWSGLHASDSIFGAPQDDKVALAAKGLLSSLDPWRLAAVEQLTYAGKSLILALCILKGRVGLKEALNLVRLEENFQAEEWGEVEAGHDLDKADMGTRVAGAIVFLGLL